MKLIPKLLWCAVAAEIVGAAVVIVYWMREPIPPRADIAHYHPATSDEIRALEKKVFSDPTAENWLSLGKTYLFFGMFAESEYCCKQSAGLDSRSFAAHYWWAVALNQVGETEQAIEKFRLALPLAESAPGETDAIARCWYGIGRNYLRREDVKNAEKAFRKAPEHAPSRHQLIRILVRSERAAEALPLLNDLIIHFPNESSYFQLRARAKAQLKDAAGALEDRTHVERAPGRLRSDAIIYELQNAAGTSGVYRELRQCDQLLAREPQQAVERLRNLLAAEWRLEISGLLVEAEMRIGNAQQAVDLLKTMIERDGPSTEMYEQMANGHEALGQQNLAFELRKRIVAIRRVATVHAALALDYKERSEPEMARKHQALAHMTGGIDKFRRNSVLAAGVELQKALDINPDLADAWYYLGECRRAQGQAARAAEAYRNCLKADENHGRSRSRLEKSLRRLSTKSTT